MNKTAEGAFIDNTSRVIVLGKTHSVISVMQDQNRTTNQKIFNVYRKGSLVSELSSGGVANLEFSDASLKYGYTAQEFFEAIKSISINIDSLPAFNNNLFDVSGTLRSCISAITSFYGYYWYVDKKSIVLISSATANSISIKDETSSTDSSILSATFTKGGRSPRVVASFYGSSNPEDNTGGGGSFGYSGLQKQANKKQFNRVLFNKYFSAASKKSISGKELSVLFSFFYSEYAKKPENFDKLIYLFYHYYPDFSLSPIYEDTPFELGKSKTLAKIVGDKNLKEHTAEIRHFFIKDGAEYLSLMTNDGKSVMKNPSGSTAYSIASLYFKYFSTLFISNGYSDAYREPLTFIGSNASVSGPFRTSISIKDIEELADIANFLANCGYTVPTVGELAREAGSRLGDNYWIAQTKGSLAAQDEDPFEFLKEIQLGYAHHSHSYMALNPSVEKGAITAAAMSSMLAYESAKNNLKPYILVAAIRVYDKDAETEATGGGGALSEEEVDLPAYEIASVSVQSQNVDDFSKSELKSYSGNSQDVNLLKSSFLKLVGNSYELKSSSVTYYKYNVPSIIDISIDSISLSIASDGITTTITKSNKAYLPPDQSLILSEGIATNVSNSSKRMTAGVKNFLKLN